jgi:hypothetical protein
LRERGEEQLHLLGLAFLVDVTHEAIVTARDELRAGLDRVLAHALLEELVRHAPAPDRIGLGFVFRPDSFLAAELDRLIAFELHRLLDELFDFRDALINALLVKLVDFISRLEIAEQNVVVDRGAVLRVKRVDILLREEKMAEIEQLEISAKELLRDLVI